VARVAANTIALCSASGSGMTSANASSPLHGRMTGSSLRLLSVRRPVAGEDDWSDIDLAFRLAPGLEPVDVGEVWTGWMYENHDVVDHLDVWSGSVLFRVFLLSSSMQVDLSSWPSDTFAASGRSFRLLFGEANDPKPSPLPAPKTLIGMGWLYALHARSSIARGRYLQALYMVNGVRDQVVSLACLRYGLPAHQGRGVDDLPREVVKTIADTLVRGLDPSELSRAFASAIRALLGEAEQIDPGLALRLREPVRELVRTAAGPRPEQTEDAAR